MDATKKPLPLVFGNNEPIPTEVSNKPISELDPWERKVRFIGAIQADDMVTVKAILNENYSNGRFQPEESYTPSEQISAICMAIEKGNLEMVQLMIDHGCSVNHYTSGFSPLHYAATYGQPEIIKLLLKEGADLNALSCHGNNALQLAAQTKSLEAVQLLIDAGSNIEKANANGQTPLAIACINNRLETVEFLLRLGADVNTTDNRGNTPLLHSIDQCLTINHQLVKILLDAGANPDHMNDNGDLALVTAIRRASETNLDGQYAIKELIDHNCALDKVEVGFLKQNAIHVAISRSQDRIIEMLIRAGCDLDIMGIEGYTPLERLVMADNYNMVNLLLNAGAKPELSKKAIEKLSRFRGEERYPLQLLIADWRGRVHSLKHLCRLKFRRYMGRQCGNVIRNHLFMPASPEILTLQLFNLLSKKAAVV
uniref:SOCS box domain-containing protein n=1 Tax=Tetranychus urticae TaxID=32264 RepID=T1JYG8_TETUR